MDRALLHFCTILKFEELSIINQRKFNTQTVHIVKIRFKNDVFVLVEVSFCLYETDVTLYWETQKYLTESYDKSS